MLVPHPSTPRMSFGNIQKTCPGREVHFSPSFEGQPVDPAVLIQGSHVGNCPLQPFSQLAATHWSTSLLEVVVCTADLQGAMPFCSHSCTAPVILGLSSTQCRDLASCRTYGAPHTCPGISGLLRAIPSAADHNLPTLVGFCRHLPLQSW